MSLRAELFIDGATQNVHQHVSWWKLLKGPNGDRDPKRDRDPEWDRDPKWGQGSLMGNGALFWDRAS